MCIGDVDTTCRVTCLAVWHPGMRENKKKKRKGPPVSQHCSDEDFQVLGDAFISREIMSSSSKHNYCISQIRIHRPSCCESNPDLSEYIKHWIFDKISVADPWHIGVDPDLDPRIHDSDGSGSCYFRRWPSRSQHKTNKDKKSKISHKAAGIIRIQLPKTMEIRHFARNNCAFSPFYLFWIWGMFLFRMP